MTLDSTIDAMTSWESRGASLLLGVVLHHVVFRRGEWDLQALNIMGSMALAYAVATAAATLSVLHHHHDDDDFPGGSSGVHMLRAVAPAAASAAASWMLAGIAGLYGSILVYRATALHRLSRFPGPFLARLSNFYQTWLTWRGYRFDAEMERLHRIYGDIVRIGLFRLSVREARIRLND